MIEQAEAEPALEAIRRLPDIKTVIILSCPLCGSVVYVSLHDDSPGGADLSDEWDALWSLNSLDDATVEHILQDTLRVSMPAGTTIPVIRVVPNNAISDDEYVDPLFRCHNADTEADSENSVPAELAAIKEAWKEVLALPGGVADDDDFYDLGGDSLLAVRVAAKISKELSARVPLGLLYKHTVASDLARALRRIGPPG
jgi:acyl carrier protein